jgi:tetratricopeptide (TPR) repeat protein
MNRSAGRDAVKIHPIAALSLAFAALVGTHAVARTAQDPAPPSAQQLFEAGDYDGALAALQRDSHDATMTTEDHYLASMILLRKSPPETDRAREELDAVRADDREAWKQAGASAQAIADNNIPAALEAATAAVAADPDLFAAQYQLGIARARTDNWTGAAAALERATEIDPDFAYAHYYAGIAYSRLRRPDQESRHFELFVKLAPKAPERLAVESILRTLRGR